MSAFALGKYFALCGQVPIRYNIPIHSGAEGETGRGYDNEVCGGSFHIGLGPSSRGRASYLPM